MNKDFLNASRASILIATAITLSPLIQSKANAGDIMEHGVVVNYGPSTSGGNVWKLDTFVNLYGGYSWKYELHDYTGALVAQNVTVNHSQGVAVEIYLTNAANTLKPYTEILTCTTPGHSAVYTSTIIADFANMPYNVGVESLDNFYNYGGGPVNKTLTIGYRPGYPATNVQPIANLWNVATASLLSSTNFTFANGTWRCTINNVTPVNQKLQWWVNWSGAQQTGAVTLQSLNF